MGGGLFFYRKGQIMKNHSKYKVGYFMPPNPTTKWVTRDRVEKTPIWCSVDLRDGNQALIVPMNLKEKLEFFQFLVSLGFKEIEVGFPAASETEYALLRTLIEKDLIPDDVTVQVLTQSREHIICLLYTSDAADEEDSVDLGGRRIIKKKKKKKKK